MSEEELQREIVSGAFSMQVADCERNIRIQFERLQQERDLYKKVIEEVREYAKRFDIERLHETCEHNLAEVLEDLLQILEKAKDVK